MPVTNTCCLTPLPSFENGLSFYHVKKATRANVLMCREVRPALWRGTIFFPSCLSIFHSFIWVYFLPTNPSNKFLFGSTLVPFGCLLPNHALQGHDKEATATLEMGKQSAWCAHMHFKIDWHLQTIFQLHVSAFQRKESQYTWTKDTFSCSEFLPAQLMLVPL